MLDLGANAGLQSFDLVVYRIDGILQVQAPSLAGPHRNMPSSRSRLLTLFDALIPSVGINILFFTVQQRMGSIDVVHIGRCAE